jgi:tetratricopeptide (TPR) repeat protein
MIAKSKLLSIIALVIFISTATMAQSINDAINLYNQGVGLMKSDVAGAIVPFEECIVKCEQIGDSAASLKEKAINILPDLYFQKAYKILVTDKKIFDAVAASRVAISVAKKYNNGKSLEKSEKLLCQSYLTMGGNSFSAKDYNNAIKAFDSALVVNPDYLKAIFNKALSYRALNDPVKYGEMIDLYIERLKSSGDTAQIASVNKQALDYYRLMGSKADAANKLDDAISLLTSAKKYGTDKDVFYFLADVQNKQKKFDEALTNAQKGLEMETGTPEAKAKFYYALAVAQAGKGDKENACGSFKNALYGPFLEPSKAQMTNLKCPK